MMRCFIALDMPILIKDRLYGLQRELNNKDAKVKWVEKKNLHLTLKFLGEIDEDRVKQIDDKLKVIKLKNFKASLGSLGVFPNKNFIRVVFVELNPADEAVKLQQEIDSELISMFPKDERFHSHVTLGRVEFVKDKNSFLERIENTKIEGSFEVKDFKLFKSILTKDGPKYEVLETYFLT